MITGADWSCVPLFFYGNVARTKKERNKQIRRGLAVDECLRRGRWPKAARQHGQYGMGLNAIVQKLKFGNISRTFLLVDWPCLFYAVLQYSLLYMYNSYTVLVQITNSLKLNEITINKFDCFNDSILFGLHYSAPKICLFLKKGASLTSVSHRSLPLSTSWTAPEKWLGIPQWHSPPALFIVTPFWTFQRSVSEYVSLQLSILYVQPGRVLLDLICMTQKKLFM